MWTIINAYLPNIIKLIEQNRLFAEIVCSVYGTEGRGFESLQARQKVK